MICVTDILVSVNLKKWTEEKDICCSLVKGVFTYVIKNLADFGYIEGHIKSMGDI